MKSNKELEELVNYIYEKTGVSRKAIIKILETERDYFMKQIIN